MYGLLLKMLQCFDKACMLACSGESLNSRGSAEVGIFSPKAAAGAAGKNPSNKEAPSKGARRSLTRSFLAMLPDGR